MAKSKRTFSWTLTDEPGRFIVFVELEREEIQAVEGITHVAENRVTGGFVVYIDLRYDWQDIRDELEAMTKPAAKPEGQMVKALRAGPEVFAFITAYVPEADVLDFDTMLEWAVRRDQRAARELLKSLEACDAPTDHGDTG